MLSGLRTPMGRIVRKAGTASHKSWIGASALTAFVGGAVATGVAASASDALHPAEYDWEHNGLFESYNSASLRRGYEVYRQVCSTCHSMEYICYRNLVGVSHTEEQAKALAQTIEVKDGPNDQGEYFERKGKLSDAFPSPYPNDEYARMINAGALPPDLSLITKARHGGADYIFALLTGYRDAPAGITLREGLHYNPYFPGGAIGMAKALQDEGVEYEDGVEATVSQQAKDVSAFLAWCAEPEQDDRKKQGVKFIMSSIALGLIFGYYKRFKYNIFKTRKITYTNHY